VSEAMQREMAAAAARVETLQTEHAQVCGCPVLVAAPATHVCASPRM
jgi:hypothetical protein